MTRRLDHRPAASILGAAVRLVVGSFVLLAGCAGGSGSSGFDLAENGAIVRALDEERCVRSDGLTICPVGGVSTPTAPAPPTETVTPPPTPTPPETSGPPTDTPTPPGSDMPTPSPPITNPDVTATPTERGVDATRAPTAADPSPTVTPTVTRTASPTPTPTPTAGEPRIDVSLGEANAVACEVDGGACSFSFAFAPLGFPPGASYQVAARRRNPDGEWRVFPAVEVSFDPAGAVFEAFIVLPLDPARGEPFTAQVAVLVFLSPSEFQSPAVDALGQSGADLAFVTRELSVVPQ
jgi:hypothetical protein